MAVGSDSAPTIVGNLISSNTAAGASGAGGGIRIDSSSTEVLIAGNTISGNSSDYNGGGLYVYAEAKILCINNLFYGNETSQNLGGAASFQGGVSGNFINNTVVDNSSGIHAHISNITVKNCILWNHGTETLGCQLSYCDVRGGPIDRSNISADPLFVDPDSGDFHLKSQAGRWDPISESWVVDNVTSPCIDAGDNSMVPQSRFGLTDLDGNPRIANSTVDMGAYESRIVQPKTAYNPNPADGAEYVYPNVELSWSPGDGAQLHIVYFGDNFDDVNNDAGGILLETATYTPGPLELDKVYYWRVDEFEGVVIHKGEVWSFTIEGALEGQL